MHNAPSVAFPVGRCSFAHWLYLGFVSVTTCVWVTWAIVQPVSVWMVMGAVCLVSASAMGYAASSQKRGTLNWDGNGWCLLQPLEHPEMIGLEHPRVSLDFQWVLLLRLRPLSDSDILKSRWLWLCRQDDPSCWHAIRLAIYACGPLS